MLRVNLIGHLGSDPELRSTQKGSPLIGFRVGVNLVRSGPDGEREESTEWFRVRFMGRQTEFVQRLAKGARVFVTGRLDIAHYQSRDGEPRTAFDVWADEVQSLSPRSDAEPASAISRHPQAPAGQRSSSVAKHASQSRPRVDHGDDLPF